METTLQRWLDEFEADVGEPIIDVSVGTTSSWGDYGLEAFVEADDKLAVQFNDGYGAPGCPAAHAWTESWVFGIDCYDGATRWFKMPRNPTNDYHVMPGGG